MGHFVRVQTSTPAWERTTKFHAATLAQPNIHTRVGAKLDVDSETRVFIPLCVEWVRASFSGCRKRSYMLSAQGGVFRN
jgi:hypothetical protein